MDQLMNILGDPNDWLFPFLLHLSAVPEIGKFAVWFLHALATVGLICTTLASILKPFSAGIAKWSAARPDCVRLARFSLFISQVVHVVAYFSMYNEPKGLIHPSVKAKLPKPRRVR